MWGATLGLTSQHILQRLHAKMDAMEEARGKIEQTLKEALEEFVKREKLLEVAKKEIEKSEKAYKIFLKRKIPLTQSTLVASLLAPKVTIVELAKIKKFLANNKKKMPI